MKGFDCATKLNANTAKALKTQFDYVGRYLASNWKGLTQDEIKAIQAAGLNLFTVFENEKHKPDPRYCNKNQGIQDAILATKYAKSLGQPKGSVIYFAIDFNAQTSHIDDIHEYFDGVNQVMVDYEVGVYGNYTVVNALKGKVNYFWQTYAWSGGKVADFIHIHQHENNVEVNGVFVDKNNIFKEPGAWFTVKEEGEIDMLDKAILIGSFPDFAVAEPLAARLMCPIYTRASYPGGKVARELYVVGGSVDGLQADKMINLSGANRFEVAAKVADFLK